MSVRITNDLGYASNARFAAELARLEAAPPAPESFDATAALRRVMQLAGRLDEEDYAGLQPWMIARLIRVAVADDLRAAVAGD